MIRDLLKSASIRHWVRTLILFEGDPITCLSTDIFLYFELALRTFYIPFKNLSNE